MQRSRSRQKGFTLVEIMAVVGIIGMLAVIAIPNFAKSRANAQRDVCIENLTQIESAKQIFGVEKGKEEGYVVTEAELIGPMLYMKNMPRCPAGGNYDFKAIGGLAECSFKANLNHYLVGTPP